MVFKRRITDEVRAYVKYHQGDLLRHSRNSAAVVQRLVKKCKISKTSVYRLLKEPLNAPKTSRKGSGRKQKLSPRFQSRVIRNIPKIRQINKNWTAGDLMKFSDITEVSERTTQRILNRHGYHHQVARKKGVISKADCTKRLQFAKKNRHREKSFWQNQIAFYFDGAGFQHKTNPYESATSCRGKVWRKDDEGLHSDCTAKGSKVGYGGKQAKFFVAISYNRGVILAKQYEKLNGESFAKFIRDNFPTFLLNCGKTSLLWLQDGDPSQSSKKAQNVQIDGGAHLFTIPP